MNWPTRLIFGFASGTLIGNGGSDAWIGGIAAFALLFGVLYEAACTHPEKTDAEMGQ